jgi:lysophospholipase L1-like esterase
MKLSPTRLQPFFALLGYAVISFVIVVVLLEFSSFVVWTAYHWVRPDLQENVADSSPAHRGYPWATEFWQEERSRWKSQHGSYEPFRIWGVAPWNGKYINADNSPNGTWRRTINPSNSACEKQSIEVWMFGGSTLYGTGVPDWATIPSYLSRDLNSAATACILVRNFGVEGYVTNQEVILLMEQLKAGGRPGMVIFYDGVNDSFAGAISPGVATAHMSLSNIKARVEGTVAGRLDFLRSSYTFQVAVAALNSLRLSTVANSGVDETESKVAATLDNYERNLQIATILGKAYGFRVFCFWQPAFVFSHKPLFPFEMTIAGNQAAKKSFNVLNKVYQHAQRRAATDNAFVFLGDIFDSVNEPVYIDKWMHLAPLGNELVARSVADYVEASLENRSKPSEPHLGEPPQ